LGESERGADEIRESTAGALPEGAAVDEGSAADSAQRGRLPPLPGQPKSAGDLSLDLAASLDEPEQLVRMLIVAAQEHVGYSENTDKWKVVLGHAAQAAKELEKLNQPSRRP
jgi:hypothetical protein